MVDIKNLLAKESLILHNRHQTLLLRRVTVNAFKQ